jgi:hypothetical protein
LVSQNISALPTFFFPLKRLFLTEKAKRRWSLFPLLSPLNMAILRCAAGAILGWALCASASFYNDYFMIPSLDSPGHTIHHMYNSSVGQVKYYCDRLPHCVAFNTDGEIKTAVTPRSSWTDIKGDSRPQSNPFYLFVKNSYSIPPDSLKGRYQVYKGCNILDNNIVHLSNRTIRELKMECNKLKQCSGFNSYGWLKDDIPNQSKWTFTGEPTATLYIRGKYETYKSQQRDNQQ